MNRKTKKRIIDITLTVLILAASFGPTKTRIRYTSFEIYRILAELSFRELL